MFQFDHFVLSSYILHTFGGFLLLQISIEKGAFITGGSRLCEVKWGIGEGEGGCCMGKGEGRRESEKRILVQL